ncbi:hypothetical protein U1Q18_019455 [Sarracenia purpurea var. burkii]
MVVATTIGGGDVKCMVTLQWKVVALICEAGGSMIVGQLGWSAAVVPIPWLVELLSFGGWVFLAVLMGWG